MDRRSFVTMGAIGLMNPFLQSVSDAQPTPKAKNIVLVHGLLPTAHVIPTPTGGRAECHVGPEPLDHAA